MRRDYSSSLQFHSSLGRFYQVWCAVEFSVDLAIGMFLKIPDEQTHRLTAAMEFGRKAVFLRSLIANSDHKQKDNLVIALNALQNESMRNVFAHSFIMSSPKDVSFVERSPHGKFQVHVHPFTPAKFKEHVARFVRHAQDFENALGIERDVFERFGQAALKFKAKA